MNNNPIEELRRMETPVTEEGWNSIVNDRRYACKFGRKNGLSPKGRAAIIGGAAAVLIAVPILVKTLTHSAKETAQTNIPTTENVQPATENVASTSTATSAETTPTTVSAAKSEQETHTPSKIAVTEQAAKHEGSTMTSVIAKRQQNAVNQSREEWPPVLFPEPDGSRLSYDNLKTNPTRHDTTGMRRSERIRTVIGDSFLDQNINAGISETTVAADGQVSTKYEYSPEEPVTETVFYSFRVHTQR